MPNWGINIIDGPVVEPVTLDELKSQTHITHAYQDTTLTAYLLAGREAAEVYQRRSYITQTLEMVLDCIPTHPIYLLRGPVQELVSVKVYDENNDEIDVEISNFYVETSHTPAKLVLNDSGEWPNVTLRRVGAVKIQYKAGYGDAAESVPNKIKHAIILFASFADDNRAVEEVEIPRCFYDLLKSQRVEINAPW